MKKFLFFISTLFLLFQGFAWSQKKVWTLEECIKYA
ncbi:MAG: hypothetical protein QG611_513, partial [Bacteroidota bacterium]|nr:hypothetical protein [Bacteroidota bacterium]